MNDVIGKEQDIKILSAHFDHICDGKIILLRNLENPKNIYFLSYKPEWMHFLVLAPCLLNYF